MEYDINIIRIKNSRNNKLIIYIWSQEVAYTTSCDYKYYFKIKINFIISPSLMTWDLLAWINASEGAPNVSRRDGSNCNGVSIRK